MKRYSRDQIKARFDALIANDDPIVISSAGLGMVAHFAERGGADMLAVYSGSYFRLQGLPEAMACMDIYDCNDLSLALGKRVRNAVKQAPLMAGVVCTDASKDMDEYFDDLIKCGFSAIMNYPSPGMYDERIRDDMEHSGAGIDVELAAIQKAYDKGLYIVANIFTAADAEKIASGSIDMAVLDLGFTQESLDRPLDDCVREINEVELTVHQAKPGIPFLVRGGPAVTTEATEYLYAHTNIDGVFLGAASDSMAISKSITDAVADFKSRPLGGGCK